MKGISPLSKRLLLLIIRTCDKTVNRHGNIQNYLTHFVPPLIYLDCNKSIWLRFLLYCYIQHVHYIDTREKPNTELNKYRPNKKQPTTSSWLPGTVTGVQKYAVHQQNFNVKCFLLSKYNTTIGNNGLSSNIIRVIRS